MKQSRSLTQYNSYFKKIDSEQKAYYLGYFYGDGNLTYSESKGRVRYFVCFHCSDKTTDFLNRLKKCLGSGNKLIRHNSSYKLKMDHEEMFKDILRSGYPNDGKKNLKPPKSGFIPEKYLRDFIRGYFDGKGYVSYQSGFHKHRGKLVKRKKFQIGIYGTYAMCRFAVESMYKMGGLKIPSITEDPKGGGRGFSIKYSGEIFLKTLRRAHPVLQKFYEVIYDHSTVWRKRNRAVFEMILLKKIK